MPANVKWMSSNDNGQSGWFYDPKYNPNGIKNGKTNHCFVEIPAEIGRELEAAVGHSIEIEVTIRKRFSVPESKD